MDLDELAARLAALESSEAEKAALAEKQQFIDKYGTKFSGDEGIGMAILGEMNRRGISAAAVGADKVVQEILDGIRAEATAILDAIHGEQQAVSNLMDQVQDIQDSVAAATGSAPGDGTLDMPPEMPPVDAALAPSIPPEGSPPSPEGNTEMPASEPPPAVEPPVEESGGPAPIEQAPIPSDKRVKRIIKVNRKPQANMWKPSNNLLGAIKGGI